MERTIEQVRAGGVPVTFAAFMALARELGENGALWVRYKHNGAIETYFENGVHMVRVLA